MGWQTKVGTLIFDLFPPMSPQLVSSCLNSLELDSVLFTSPASSPLASSHQNEVLLILEPSSCPTLTPTLFAYLVHVQFH